jgi:protein tyrosine phosphatase
MLALLYLLNELYGKKMKTKIAPQTVIQVIHIMRKYRPHLVQSTQQLRFIFDVLTHFQAIDPLTQDQWMEFENDFEKPEFQRPRYLLAGHGEASCPTKNRYSNVKPYAERSLDLTGHNLYSSDYCGPTYINASPLPPVDQLYLTRRQMNPNDPPPELNPKDSYMIAAQCPPNNAAAINDFNQMLLAHDVRVIIDLTRFDEGGSAKCVDYTNGTLTRQLNKHTNVPFIVTLYAKQQPHRYLDLTGMFFGQSQPVHPSPLPNRPLTLKQLNEMFPSKCDSESEV